MASDAPTVHLSVRELQQRWGFSRSGLKARPRSHPLSPERCSTAITTRPVMVPERVERPSSPVAPPHLEPLPDPLRTARLLAEAADLAVPLSGAELAGVLGLSASTISRWGNGHCLRPGMTLQREGRAGRVWWTLRRDGCNRHRRPLSLPPL
ncbi:hypothetical protein EVJ50_10965 [Synechococcus sp. RSCCF101]|uniref:hypothetical protein n=1 Tax=Synechococcus sp. RSCCF101 TaxID=2511069 RepID=UPI001243C457|nr:hypothetical protein [Synechococcus sp. RSCCF101]QEY32665.1 hypothetical protein EVJ50_10965 [Synechococcus sp. RSCCF101]